MWAPVSSSPCVGSVMTVGSSTAGAEPGSDEQPASSRATMAKEATMRTAGHLWPAVSSLVAAPEPLISRHPWSACPAMGHEAPLRLLAGAEELPKRFANGRQDHAAEGQRADGPQGHPLPGRPRRRDHPEPHP